MRLKLGYARSMSAVSTLSNSAGGITALASRIHSAMSP